MTFSHESYCARMAHAFREKRATDPEKRMRWDGGSDIPRGLHGAVSKYGHFVHSVSVEPPSPLIYQESQENGGYHFARNVTSSGGIAQRQRLERARLSYRTIRPIGRLQEREVRTPIRIECLDSLVRMIDV